jgi:integrase
MRGAPARAIQELAGHKDLSMTQRYMHLSPAALESAVQLLDSAGIPRVVETAWRRELRKEENVEFLRRNWR